MRSVNYHPIRFYITVYAVTWTFWILASRIQDPSLSMTLMLLGLITPAVTAVVTVMFSGSQPLKADLKRKLTGFADLHPLRVLRVVLFFGLLAGLSILASILFFGQPWSQFSFTEGFSFSIQGSSALLTILVASVIEEVGWRGYGEDSIAQSCNWFWESIWFGVIWSLWHLPLFFIPGTYQAGLMQLGPGHVLNFLVSVIPLGFITTLVYVENKRSMLACILFHLFVNFFQEKIAMTPETKCVETLFITLAAVIIILRHRRLFFETDHIGRLPL